MIQLRLEALSKTYPGVQALHPLDLTIPAGSFFFLLGPSGCGKTTLLRIIAGFIPPTSGRLWLGGPASGGESDREITGLPAHRRPTAMVFQHYALWPHLSVYEQIAFGLRARHLPSHLIDKKVQEMLALVELEPMAHRRPAELSGGQQQRVALARALAVEPQCLLLDEPLSNLDARLREQMRQEIRRLVKTLGLTALYVTHDPKEALALGDQMAILEQGHLVGSGTPLELYRHPKTRFIASFLGDIDALPGRVIERHDDRALVETPAGITQIRGPMLQRLGSPQIELLVRPERVRLLPSDSPQGWLGQRLAPTGLGELVDHPVALPGGTQLRSRLFFGQEPPGPHCRLWVEPEDWIVVSSG